MKIYLCGSFKFYDDMKAIYNEFISSYISCSISKPGNTDGIGGCLASIEQADILYVINPDGYIGKSVALDIGYALGLNRKIYAMNEITDPPISKLIDGVKSPPKLIKFVQDAN